MGMSLELDFDCVSDFSSPAKFLPNKMFVTKINAVTLTTFVDKITEVVRSIPTDDLEIIV